MKNTGLKFTTESLSLNDLARNDAIWQRDFTENESAIKMQTNIYAEDMKEGVKFPPIFVCRTPEGENLVVDGRMRVAAAEIAGRSKIPAKVFYGSEEDALFHACGVNGDHGLSTNTDADKRRRVSTLLSNQNFLAALPSNCAIARYTKVSEGFVRKMLRELNITLPEIAVVKKVNGGEYLQDRSAIGRNSKRAQSVPESSKKAIAKNAVLPPIIERNLKEVASKTKVDLVITMLPTAACLEELRANAAALLACKEVAVVFLDKAKLSSPEMVSNVIAQLSGPQANILASKQFKAGISLAGARFVGTNPDLSVRKPELTSSPETLRANPSDDATVEALKANF